MGLQVMQLLMEHENAWPFMGTGPGDQPAAGGRRLDLCGVVERLQVLQHPWLQTAAAR